MIQQIRALTGLIDEYQVSATSGLTHSPNLRERILESINQVWKIIGKDGVTIGRALGTLEKGLGVEENQYGEKVAILNKYILQGKNIKEGVLPGQAELVTRKAKLEFMKGMLELFGIPNVEHFIIRGSLGVIENQIVTTKIRAEALVREEIKGEDLGGFDAIMSGYEVTYSALLDRKSALTHIIKEELIAPLAETFPFPATKPMRGMITYAEQRAILLEYFEKAERHLHHLQSLSEGNIGRKLNALTKIARRRTDTEKAKLSSLHEKFFGSGSAGTLRDMYEAVIRSFGVIPPRKKYISEESLTHLPTDKILKALRGAISFVLYTSYPDLQKIRANERKIEKMLRKYKSIWEKYQPSFKQLDQDPEREFLVAQLTEALESWEFESTILLDEYSLKSIRLLRSAIIKDVTTSYPL